ncbi:MAG: zinc ribbon domain-containing protein [Planctomycetota bacterium]|nr:MAG: zinc ribbon domain-containing protein [Planctomycetota bacterium]
MDDPSVVEAILVEEDAEASSAVFGETCPACGAPHTGEDQFCRSCGTELGPPSPEPERAEGPPRHTFQCKNCGSLVATTTERRSYVCPFCDSAYVTEIDVRESGRQRPEFIIGFTVTAQQAQQKFHDWIGRNAWFRPGDLKLKAMTDRQRGVYLPFWHFTAFAASRWRARIGEYWYRTETYTVTDSKGRTTVRTRQVRETEWFPLEGEHEKYYWGILIPGTSSITAAEARAIQPFHLDALRRYDASFIAGWMAEEYTVPPDQAAEVCRGEIENREVVAVRNFLPGDTYRNLEVRTRIEFTGRDLILLPVHVLSYRYRDKVYRFLVNGQTGKVTGQKPVSARRIAVVVALAVAVIAILVAVVILSQQ